MNNEYGFINFTGFVGKSPNYCSFSNNGMQNESWVIDSGASMHMCHSYNLFHNLTKLKQPSKVSLPNGSTKLVLYSGDIKINSKLNLQNVIYLPFFKYNMLSVSALTKTSNIVMKFFIDHCILQDRVTQEVIATRSLQGGLYMLNKNGCIPFRPHNNSVCYIYCTAPTSNINETHSFPMNSYMLWHHRQCHIFNIKLVHITTVKLT